MATAGAQASDNILQQLQEGFEALSQEYKLLWQENRNLENKLAWAKQQYLTLLKSASPATSSQDFPIFLDELEQAGSSQQNGNLDWLEHLTKSHDPDTRTRAYKVRQAEIGVLGRKCQEQPNSGVDVTIWGGNSTDNGLASPGLEQDFTTAGTPSRLRCPFNKLNKSRPHTRTGSTYTRQSVTTPRSSHSRRGSSTLRSKRASFHDPIRAEICGLDSASPATSVDGSAAVCPIRFLDQHSPEEVAQYFEKHKHEIPRSHEVCVKSHQMNAESIRKLDAKYGNLVSMIQGLGEKHQSLLPDKLEDEVAVEDDKSNEKVRDWAHDVSTSLKNGQNEYDEQSPRVEEDRQPRFDRPLKEVRVGESPSRPWGISVPAKYHILESTGTRFPEPTNDLDEKAADAAQKCPFDHTKMRAATPSTTQHVETPGLRRVDSPGQPTPQPAFISNLYPAEQSPQDSLTGKAVKSTAPQMVFNGPVFIGYSQASAIRLLAQMGYGDKT